MRSYRPLLPRLLSMAPLCLIGGIAGGLGFGYVLSRRGAWLTPLPWAIYTVLLLVVFGTASWLDERHRLRIAEQAWPLPADYTAAAKVSISTAGPGAPVVPDEASLEATTMIPPATALTDAGSIAEPVRDGVAPASRRRRRPTKRRRLAPIVSGNGNRPARTDSD